MDVNMQFLGKFKVDLFYDLFFGNKVKGNKNYMKQ